MKKDWQAKYPKEIKADILENEKEIVKGKVLADKDVKKLSAKWLKKYSWENALKFFDSHRVSLKNYKFDREEVNER